MTDRELEQRLRAWYAAEVGGAETAPADLREALENIPATTRVPLRPLTRRRGFTLLAAAALLVAGGALVVGSGAVRPGPVVTPAPNVAVVGPSGSPAIETPVPTPTSNIRPGAVIAFIRTVDKERTCLRSAPLCSTSRVWIIGSDGRGAHELLPDGVDNQGGLAWSPDGAHLFYVENDTLYATDANASGPRPAESACSTSCVGGAPAALSRDGSSLAFVRAGSDASGGYSSVIATLDLATGRVEQLAATGPDGTGPGWSPDGRRLVFFRYGTKDDGGPIAPVLSSIWVVDIDGQNLQQISPPTLAAQDPAWSPDGTRILFESVDGDHLDIYVVRPDGTDLRRLTTDGVSTSATWAPDGRILFARGSGSAGGDAGPGWWTMAPDGSQPTLLVPASEIGVTADKVEFTRPVWQPVGGAAIAALPWTPETATTVGPPAPTPSPTPTPDLAPGFSWAATAIAADGTALGDTATRLADGHVLFTANCSTAASLYDPSSGTFSPTGSLSVVRSGKTATLLRDGRVLFAGGSDCPTAGTEGIWASAELYDPSTGTFSPTGSMHAPREAQTATLLADGRVLIAGGLTGPSASATMTITLASYRLAETDANYYLATAETYDPLTGTFSKTGSMSMARRGHTATLLQDGRVLVVGNGGESSPSSKIADLYDPATGRFTRTGSMKVGRWLHTATLLQDGRVLILGGRSPQDAVYTSAETYDPRSGSFSSAGSMSEGRQNQTATLLPDGQVLIAGGYWSDGQHWRVLSSTEMYDPSTGNVSPLGSMGTARDGHTATLLDDGRVLFVGGAEIGPSGGISVLTAVIYQP